MKVLGIAGWSGAGKTTLIVRLVPALTAHGLTVSTLKHAHHAFDIDKPGKDSWAHRQAGATEVMVASANRWALMREHRGTPEPTLDDLVARMAPVDVLLVEGFKHGRHDKIEVHRPSLGKPMLQPDDPSVVAVVSDEALAGLPVPVLDFGDVAGIADIVLALVDGTRRPTAALG